MKRNGMNNRARILVPLLLAAVMIVMNCISAFAAVATVDYSAEGEFTFTIDETGVMSTTDLFGINFKDLMPGDHVERDVTIKRNAPGVQPLNFYMKALTDPDSVERDFLSQLKMKLVAQSGWVLYESSPEKTAQLTDYVLLCDFNAGDAIKIKVVLDVPIELGNEYQNRKGEVIWQFMVSEKDNPGPHPDPKPDPTPTPTPTPTPIPQIIEAVKTGDTTSLVLYGALFAASLAAISAVIVALTKKKKEQ